MSPPPLPRIAILGAGNVATHLALSFGHEVVAQIWARDIVKARALAERVGTSATSSLDDIIDDADLYIISVSDDAIAQLAARLQGRRGLWTHTSGSIPASVLDGVGTERGVFYPLQTFSADREVDMPRVPIFLEASSPEAMDTLRRAAHLLTPRVYEADSERRRRLHIAAVFACNFTNYMWVAADRLLGDDGLDLSVLAPLIEATAAKAVAGNPEAGQTGPARRGDRGVIASHEAMLADRPELREIYTLISQSILNHYAK